MLRKLGRNGLVERTITTRLHTSRIIAGRYASGSFTLALSIRAQSSSIRLLSTSTPPPSKPSTTETPSPVSLDLTQSPPRKQKVDLKPAPVKLPSKAPNSTSKHQPDTLTSDPPTHEFKSGFSSTPASASGSTSSTSAPVSSSSISGGVSEAKRDILLAEEQGVLAPPPADAGRIKRLIHHAKELFKFYWNGLKMINTHRLRVAQIRLRVKEGGDPMSRAEYRFIRTYKEDVLKLIPFLIIVVIAEEVIPIIAIYAPFMMPSTTIFPSQLQRIEDKARDKQVSFADNRALFAKVVQIGQGHGKGKEMVYLPELRAAGGAKAVCGILRLATWGPPPLRLWRLDRYLRHIAEDDVLLAKEDWGARLADKDVLKALNERGIITSKLSPEQARKQLQSWLTTVSLGSDVVATRIYAVAKANA